MCVQYIGGCSVHRGVFSTSGGYHEYIGGIPWVHRGDIMSTSGGVQGGIPWVHRGVFSTSEGYHEYIGGISWVHRGMFSTSEGYHDHMGGCSVHRGDPMSTSGGYHECIMSTYIMSTSGDVQYIGVFNRNWRDFIKLLPHMYHDIPPMYWTSPDVLMISPDVLMVSLRCTEHPPMYSWYPPTFIMISPRCTEHPPMYSWYPPDVLMVSPQCTEHPPMYWTSPDVLNTHYTGWLSCFLQNSDFKNFNLLMISNKSRMFKLKVSISLLFWTGAMCRIDLL